MNQIKLKDNTTLEVVQINGQSRFFQGANRDTLEFHFQKEGNSFDNLDGLFTEENTGKITVTTEDGDFIYDDYCLRVSMSLVPVVVTQAEGTEPEVTEERYLVTMAQKTHLEKQIETLQGQVETILGGK